MTDLTEDDILIIRIGLEHIAGEALRDVRERAQRCSEDFGSTAEAHEAVMEAEDLAQRARVLLSRFTETAAILADPVAMAAIEEAQAEQEPVVTAIDGWTIESEVRDGWRRSEAEGIVDRWDDDGSWPEAKDITHRRVVLTLTGPWLEGPTEAVKKEAAAAEERRAQAARAYRDRVLAEAEQIIRERAEGSDL